jgi:hypothetical protein
MLHTDSAPTSTNHRNISEDAELKRTAGDRRSGESEQCRSAEDEPSGAARERCYSRRKCRGEAGYYPLPSKGRLNSPGVRRPLSLASSGVKGSMEGGRTAVPRVCYLTPEQKC